MKKRGPPGGSGPVIRTPAEMRAAERAVGAGEAMVHGMDVWRPAVPDWAQFEVQVYDVRFGSFVFHSYEGSIERAQRTMASLRASRHRVRHLAVSMLSRPDAWVAVDPKPAKARLDPEAEAHRMRMAELQQRLRALWAREGRADRAMPASENKLRSLIGEAQQRISVAQSRGG